MKHSNFAVTVIIAIAVAATGFVVVDASGGMDDWKENREHFEEYCTDRFGDDATVYTGGGQGVHAGLHCEDPEHKPVHLGAVEPTVWESYKTGGATTEEVTASIRPVGPMGTVGGFPNYGIALAATAGVVFVVGLVCRARSGAENSQTGDSPYK